MTVTGVEATKDFAQATVYVSVFGSEASASGRSRGCRRRTASSRRRSRGSSRLRRTPVLAFEYDPAVERGVRLAKMIDELAPAGARCRSPTETCRRSTAALREHERFLVAVAREPGRRRARVAARDAPRARAARQGQRHVPLRPGAAARASTRFLDLDERASPRAAGGSRASACSSRSTARRRSGSGRIRRMLERAPFTIDIDHHHDNTRFGDVNLIVPDASSTGEILADVFRELGVEITPEIAEPLYIALVTDTGRFQYANTSPKALRLAADLIEAGADWHKVFQVVYENVQFAKLKLLARALERARGARGRPSSSSRTCSRRTSSRSARPSRTRRGSSTTCARSRARSWRRSSASRRAETGRCTGSRCAPRSTRWTCRVIARKSGGGGHRAGRGVLERAAARRAQASSSSRSSSDAAAARALQPERDHPRGQACRADVVRRSSPRVRRRTGARTGHAGTLDPFATGLLLLLSGAATRLQPRFVGLDKRYVTEIDLTARTSTGDRRARSSRSTSRPPARSWRSCSPGCGARSSSRSRPRPP